VELGAGLEVGLGAGLDVGLAVGPDVGLAVAVGPAVVACVGVGGATSAMTGVVPRGVRARATETMRATETAGYATTALRRMRRAVTLFIWLTGSSLVWLVVGEELRVVRQTGPPEVR